MFIIWTSWVQYTVQYSTVQYLLWAPRVRVLLVVEACEYTKPNFKIIENFLKFIFTIFSPYKKIKWTIC